MSNTINYWVSDFFKLTCWKCKKKWQLCLTYRYILISALRTESQQAADSKTWLSVSCILRFRPQASLSITVGKPSIIWVWEHKSIKIHLREDCFRMWGQRNGQRLPICCMIFVHLYEGEQVGVVWQRWLISSNHYTLEFAEWMALCLHTHARLYSKAHNWHKVEFERTHARNTSAFLHALLMRSDLAGRI